MIRPATTLALLVLVWAWLLSPAQAQPRGGKPPKSEEPAKPPPPPEPEPEAVLEPEAPATAEPAAAEPSSEPAAGEGEGEPANSDGAGGADGDTGEPPSMPARADGPTVVVPRTTCEGKRVRRIDVLDNGRVSADDIRASMKLKVGSTCTDSAVARDARGLWDIGYFDDLVFSARIDGGELLLTVQVRERPAIGKITFEGDDDVDEEDIDEKVSLEVGAILSEHDVRAQLPKIRDVYAEEGYFLAKVTYQLIAMAEQSGAGALSTSWKAPRSRSGASRSSATITCPTKTYWASCAHTPPECFRSSRTATSSSATTSTKTCSACRRCTTTAAISTCRSIRRASSSRPTASRSTSRLPLVEGPRFSIGRLKVVEYDDEGNEIEPLGGRRSVREKVDVNPGDFFSRTKLTEGIESITRHYRDESYAKVEVQPETELEPDKRLVHVTVTIRRGPSCHIERIQIQGNDKTRDRVLRRETLIVEATSTARPCSSAAKTA